MYSLQLFILFFIVQKSVSFQSDWYIDYPTESAELESNAKTTQTPSYSELCPERDQSLISNNDIKYSIEDVAIKLQLKENLINGYCPKADQKRNEYLQALEDFRERLDDRPKHMLEVLDDMSSMRQNLQPEVERIEAQLNKFDIYEEKYNDIAERSDAVLRQIENYKQLCRINCDDFDIKDRLGHRTFPTSINLSKYKIDDNMYCIRLKDLHEYITAKLSQFQEEYEEVLWSEIQNRNEIYAQNLTDLKINLKEAAVKQFGMTMYEILSLQDDYYHFVADLKRQNISTELDNIEENCAEIKLRLVGLKRDAEKYRQYCMNCKSKRQYRDNLQDLKIYSDDIDITYEKYIDIGSDNIDELIKIKINEFKNIIKSDCTYLFEDLDKIFNEPDLIDTYVMKLQPIQGEIEYDIETEEEALYKLKSIFQESSKDKVVILSRDSKQTILSLKSAKQYIDQFI